MGALDYNGILDGIKTALDGDNLLDGTTVEVETDNMFATELTPWVGIYILNRTADDDLQETSSEMETVFLLRIAVVCAEYSLVSPEEAKRLRNVLVGKVEVVLTRNRTLTETVESSWLESGDSEFTGLNEDQDYLARDEITLIAKARAFL